MKSKRRTFSILFIIPALVILAPPVLAKDFPEAVLQVDPLAASSSTGVPAGLGGSFEYGNYCIAKDGDVDSFYMISSLCPVLFNLNGTFALGGIYQTDLLCGPVAPGQTAANVAAFWMNAIQFEYGLYASLALPIEGRPHLLAEYSRTSQHPLGDRDQYSQVSADLLILGIAPAEFSIGPVRILSYLRAGYSSLFDFWQSSLPEPRISWLLKPAIEAELPLLGRCSFVARAYTEFFIDRNTERPDANYFAEAGLAISEGSLDDELLFTIYDTRDSDLLANAANPTFEAGLSVRISASRMHTH
jgi:hypothetical protein